MYSALFQCGTVDIMLAIIVVGSDDNYGKTYHHSVQCSESIVSQDSYIYV